MSTSGPFFSWSLVALTLVAAVFDARTKRIPNVLSLGALLCAPLLHAVLAPRPLAMQAALDSLLAAALCGAGPLLFWRLGAVGGGDVKLVAAIGALGGLGLGLETAFLSFFCVIAFACLRLTWRGILLKSIAQGISTSVSSLREKPLPGHGPEPVPLRFGPFACAGAVLALLLHGGGLI